MQNSDSFVEQKNEFGRIAWKRVNWAAGFPCGGIPCVDTAPHMLSVFLSRDLSMNNISQLPPSPLHSLRFLEEL